MKNLIQHNPPHPGEILQEFYLEPLNLSVTSASESLQIARPNLSAIINGRAGISPLMAHKLAKAFETSPQYWLNLQSNYDLWHSMKHKEIRKVKKLVKVWIY